MTKEKLTELRAACDLYAGQPGFVGIAVDRRDLLSLLDALEAKEAELFDALEENRKLSVEVDKSGLLKRRELDEELQQIDDAVADAGGDREKGAVAFIAALRKRLDDAKALLEMPT